MSTPSAPTTDPSARVWISYGGTRFHTSPHCPGLADGQAKARSIGHIPWRVVSTSPERAEGRTACRVCRDPRSLVSSSRGVPEQIWGEVDDRVLRTAVANGRPMAMIAGMLDRPEAQVADRITHLSLGRIA